MKDNDNPFDTWLERPRVQAKTSVARSAPEVRDMLEGSWKAVQSVFGKRATPEHALMLLPHLLDAAAAERQLLRDEAATQTSGETKRSRSSRAAPR